MTSLIGSAIETLARRWQQWRRARNLRAGRVCLPSLRWSVVAGVCCILAGGALIAGHARQLAGAGEALAPHAAAAAVATLQSAVPGASFDVPTHAGMSVRYAGSAALVIASAMRAADPVRIDLCTQLQADGRLSPLRVGFQFDAIARLVASGKPVALHNVALAGPQLKDMPAVVLGGPASMDLPLSLALPKGDPSVAWIGDGGARGLRREGWLLWRDGALRMQRRPSSSCAKAGSLLLQLYRKGEPGRALVTAIPSVGPAVSVWLAPGRYTVPLSARAGLEDQALFQELQARGMVRLNRSGLIELAPRDLVAWQKAEDSERAGQLGDWSNVAADPDARRLFKRLYQLADGSYVREQVRVFNNERRLLAWRVRPRAAALAWQASIDNVPVAAAAELPASAARLFAEMPIGWGAWSRVATWPDTASRAPARITLTLPRPADGDERIELMLVGHLEQVSGARITEGSDVCTGRACSSPAAARAITLVPTPGTSTIVIDALPLELPALAGDQQYRHLSVVDGRLAWRALDGSSSTARAPELANVIVRDRHGTLLWSGGAPAPAAVAAGLGPLLGVRADQTNSVAGMLARIAAPDGRAHEAHLAIDLALQQASADALACVGMRRGRWDGSVCSGGHSMPGRQAGIVIVDTASGDILAAAGAGGAPLGTLNWNELRDFDRANPDRSPLRLPAMQHDGGAHRSPGSTFKIVSALGLELAAQRDSQLDALLAGMPLTDLNRVASRRGFAFRTDAASYPLDTRQAHITNYKDQHLDRRAVDGRLGLAQALSYSLNTWFAWSAELSDASLFGRADGGAPDLQPLEPGALDNVRPIVAMAHKLGFERAVRLDGGLMPDDFSWSPWDALQASQAAIDPIHSRHELRQMAIGLRMQATPLHMAMVAGAVGEGRVIAPRLLLDLDGRAAHTESTSALGVRLDRIRAGMKGVVDAGTAAGAFRAPQLASIRRGLSGKTGTAPVMVSGPDGQTRELATVWFAGWLEPGSVPGQTGRLAVAAFISHSEASGGEHAAPVVAAVLASIGARNREQRGKPTFQARLADGACVASFWCKKQH